MGAVDTLLGGLNSAQMEAVTAPEGHLLINAAAGTGKTTTLAARILYLQLERRVAPREFLAVSFSRAARSRLADKLERLCFDIGAGSLVRTVTFHGLAWRILNSAVERGDKTTWLERGFRVLAPMEGRTEIWERHQNEILKGLEDSFLPELRATIYASAINHVRQGHPALPRGIVGYDSLPEGLALDVGNGHSRYYGIPGGNVKKAWRRYESYLRKYNVIDYPGMICEALKVFGRKELSSGDLFGNIRHMMIDEYQDTSRVQEALAFSLAGGKSLLTVVGDNDQTIYGFNGSDSSNIIEFLQRVSRTGQPVAGKIDLVENYRSGGKILQLANRIAGKSRFPGRPEKKLVPAAGAGRGEDLDVELVCAPSLSLAADFVSSKIHELKAAGESPGDMVVLVRKDTQFYPQGAKVREALAKIGIDSEGIPEREERVSHATMALLLVCQNHYAMSLREIAEGLAAGSFADETGDADPALMRNMLDEIMNAGAEFGYEAGSFLADPGPAPDRACETPRIKTIHSAKGEEYPIVFVLYLGDRDFPSGVVPDPEEERRLLYVAITRAQRKLFVVGHIGANPDFFEECRGEGVCRRDWLTLGGRVDLGGVGLDQGLTTVIAGARQRQDEIEQTERERLRAMFEDEQ